MGLADRITELEVRLGGIAAENERLRAENSALSGEVARLKDELAADSENSSKPVCHER